MGVRHSGAEVYPVTPHSSEKKRNDPRTGVCDEKECEKTRQGEHPTGRRAPNLRGGGVSKKKKRRKY